jgi:hypothetical protein
MDSKAEEYGARYMLLVSNPADFQFERHAHPTFLCFLFRQVTPMQSYAVAIAVEL